MQAFSAPPRYFGSSWRLDPRIQTNLPFKNARSRCPDKKKFVPRLGGNPDKTRKILSRQKPRNSALLGSSLGRDYPGSCEALVKVDTLIFDVWSDDIMTMTNKFWSLWSTTSTTTWSSIKRPPRLHFHFLKVIKMTRHCEISSTRCLKFFYYSLRIYYELMNHFSRFRWFSLAFTASRSKLSRNSRYTNIRPHQLQSPTSLYVYIHLRQRQSRFTHEENTSFPV
jgi:hypothetical protein